MSRSIPADVEARIRAAALFAIVAAGIAVGAAGRNPHALAMVLLPLVYLVSSVLARPHAAAPHATRTLSSRRIDRGDTIEVTLEVSLAPSAHYVAVVENTPERSVVESGSCFYEGPVPTDGTIKLEYSIRPTRGVHRIAAPRVVVADRHLIRPVVSYPAVVSTYTVLPRVLLRAGIPIRPPSTNLFPGAIRSRRSGSGTQFFDVREYRSGDSLRHINWKSSSFPRGGRPKVVINEFEEERATDVGVVLDVRAVRYPPGTGEASLFEHAVIGAAALIESFTASGNRVGLLLYGGALRWSSPGYGKRNRERLLERLAGASLDYHGAFTELGSIPLRLFRKGTQLALVSPLDSRDGDDLARLRARGFRVFVLRPDPIRWDVGRLPDTGFVERAARFARLDYSVARERLERSGVFVAEWDTAEPISKALASESRRFAAWRPF